jgi:hypothetical protein
MRTSLSRRAMIGALVLVALSLSTSSAATTESHNVSATDFDAGSPLLASGQGGGVVALWREKHGDDWLLYSASTGADSSVFGSPTRLSDPGQDALNARVTVASNGNALAIWNRSDGSHQVVQSASRAAGQAWGAPQVASVPDADAYHPQVAMGRTGDAVAVWSRSDGEHNVIQSATLPSGGSWSKAVDLSDPANVTLTPQVAVGGDGTAVAAWQRSDGDYSTIETSVLTRGSWSTTRRLSIAGGNATNPRIAMDDAGNAVEAWRWNDGLHWIVASSFRPAGRDWQRVQQVSAPGISAASLQLAMNASGQAVVIWATRVGVFAAQLGGNGRWSTPREVDNGDDPPSTASSSPSVAIDPAGDETALWSPSGYVYGSFRAHDADAWDVSQQVDCDGGEADMCFYSYEAKAAITRAGAAVALWMTSGDDHEILTTATYDNTQPADGGDDSGDDDSSDDADADSLASSTGAVGTILDHTATLLPGKRIRVTVRCQIAHECRGHLVLRRTPARRVALAGVPVRVASGRSATLVLALTGLPRAVLFRGARLRTQVVVERMQRGRRVTAGHALVIVGRREAQRSS